MKELRCCKYCGREYEPIRYDQKFCKRECLERYFIAERREAVAAWRAQQRVAYFFGSTVQPVDDETEEGNQIRRTG